MTVMLRSLPQLHQLPMTLPLDNAVRLELVEGVPIFRATPSVHNRIVALLDKQKTVALTAAENKELDLYEEIDDYLSFVNRMVRNSMLTQNSLST